MDFLDIRGLQKTQGPDGIIRVHLSWPKRVGLCLLWCNVYGQTKRSGSSSVRDLPRVVQSQSPDDVAGCPSEGLAETTGLLLPHHRHRHHCCCTAAAAAAAPGIHRPRHHGHHHHHHHGSRCQRARRTATDCSHAARRCRSWLPTVVAGQVRV